MRSIPAALATRVRSLQQTSANNADPRLRAIITRHTVLLRDYDMWQTTVIVGVTPARTSMAARRPSADKGTDMLYVGVVDGGVGKVYRGVLKGINPPAAWTVDTTIADATDIAVAFEGHFAKRLDKVEFVTDGEPWVFWVTSAGQVWTRHDGEDTQLGADAVAVDAKMGAASIMGDVSQGLVLVMVSTSGAVVTRQYLDGVWSDGAICAEAPAGVVDASISRTWDYRLCLQLRTGDGKLWPVLGKSMISGNANTEHLSASLSLDVDVLPTIPHDAQAGDENLSTTLSLDAGVYGIEAPVIVSARNLDDGTGNWGTLLRVVFDRPVYELAGSAAAFALAVAYRSEAIAYDPEDPDKRTLLLTMADFNNAPSVASLAYTPGTLASGPSVTQVDGQSLLVVLQGLVPTAPPLPLSAVAVSNTVIDVTFSEPLGSADIAANAAALTVTGYEPLYSPGGPLQAATYGVSAAGWGADQTMLRITLSTTGRLKHPQGSITVGYAASSGNLRNAAGSMAAPSFNLPFAPGAGVVPFFNPADVENLSASLAMTVDVNQVTYVDGKSGDENLQAGLALSVAVYDASNNPV